MSAGVLLDTHTLLWMVRGDPLRAPAVETIVAAVAERQLFVSVISAWELGLLAAHGRSVEAVDFHQDPKQWFARAVTAAHARVLPLEADFAIDASLLPEPLHRDPADRMLIATARSENLVLVTRDKAILDYAALGHVRAIAC